MGAERWDEQVGSVADEAGRLLESLRRSAAQAAAGSAAHAAHDDHADAGAPAPAAGADEAQGEAHDPFCQWCPLCRGAAVVRSLSPETLSRLADLAALAASVLGELASSRPAGGAPAAAPEGAPRHPSPAPSRVIPVSDADEPEEAPRG